MSWLERKAKIKWNRLSEEGQDYYGSFDKFYEDYIDANIETIKEE